MMKLEVERYSIPVSIVYKCEAILKDNRYNLDDFSNLKDAEDYVTKGFDNGVIKAVSSDDVTFVNTSKIESIIIRKEYVECGKEEIITTTLEGAAVDDFLDKINEEAKYVDYCPSYTFSRIEEVFGLKKVYYQYRRLED